MKNGYNIKFTAFANIFLIIESITCAIPFLLLFTSSITEESTIIKNGYSLFPREFSLNAYRYLSGQANTIFRAYGITIAVTAVGTVIGLLVTTMLAYSLAQRDLPGKSLLSFIVVFSMLFNGGLVSTYVWYTGTLHIKNTFFALLVPSLITNGFLIMIATNYFRNSIPWEVLEAARVDGANEFLIYFQIVVPFSKPILASIGLMQGIAYWNDWRNGLYYLTNPKLFNLQNILNRILQQISVLSSGDAANVDFNGPLPGNSVRMAIAVIAVIPIIVIYPFFQEQFAKGLTVGSVKG